MNAKSASEANFPGKTVSWIALDVDNVSLGTKNAGLTEIAVLRDRHREPGVIGSSIRRREAQIQGDRLAPRIP